MLTAKKLLARSRRWKWLCIASVTAIAVLLLFIAIVWFLPDDPGPGNAARHLQLGQTYTEMRELLKGVHYEGIATRGDGLVLFFVDGEDWSVTIAGDHVVKIQHSPDNGPFLERARRAWELRFRELRRHFR